MEFCFGHCAFQSEDQAIVKKRGVIQAIAVGEQGIGDGTHVEQAIPIRIAPRQARDLQPKQNPYSSHGDFSIQVIESGTFDKHLARDTEIIVDGGHLMLGPPQRNRFVDERVLTCCRLAIVLHLGRMGLTNIDDGSSLRVT